MKYPAPFVRGDRALPDVGVGLRMAVAAAAIAVTVTVEAAGFLETFDGTGTLADRPPTVGAAYALDNGDPASTPTNFEVDGDGGLPSSDDTSEVISAIQNAGRSYVLWAVFTVEALDPTSFLSIDLSALTIANDNYIAEAFLRWNGSTWTLNGFVTADDTSTLFDDSVDVTKRIVVGDVVLLTMTVSDDGVSWAIDLVEVLATDQIPQSAPDTVGYANSKTAGASNVVLDTVELLPQ